MTTARTARHRAQLQQAIERDGVIAFVYQPEALSAQGTENRDYVRSKRVPVIGSEGGATWWYDNPMYFPQVAHGYTFFASAIFGAGQVLVPQGKTKLATTNCAEVPACAENARFWAENAQKAGFEHVYRARSSVTQPDYTAECLNARNNGAQVFLIALDPSSIRRLAISCARQGYKPTYATMGAIVTDEVKREPNLEGMIAISNSFPYFQTGTPATDEFQQAMRDYGATTPVGLGRTLGWTAAKVFERAATRLPEPPTSEAVLQGLWSISNDTIGGLTLPLSYHPEQSAQPLPYWFIIAIDKGRWVSPDGSKLHCQ